jgi:CheY-like chemotaxis protein
MMISPSGAAVMLPRLLVLVIDDFSLMRETLSRFMERAGHRVLCAANGRIGLEILAQQPVDLVLTDVIMPEKNGLEFIGEARKSHPRLPIVAISGGGRDMAKSYSLKVARYFGATRVVKKPFSQQELFAAIEQALGESDPEPSA